MSDVRGLLVRYLRQRSELGDERLFLETLTREDVWALLASRAPARPARPGPARAVPARQGAEARVEAAAAAGATAGPGTHERGAPTLDAVRQEALACTRCRLHQGRRTVVFGEGDPKAAVMVVGEAPGAEEDRTGRPFVGAAGKLLDRLLLSAGFPRASVYICNVLKCRPPGNRDPRPDEIASCSPYLERQLELVAPRALLAVGRFAAQALVGAEASIGTLRGRLHQRRGVPVVVTFHPAYLLRSPERLREAWQDFQLLRQVIDGEA
ncbi:MAG TPA: uracil-DNA glycosylase [Longimicrobiales bacterium]